MSQHIASTASGPAAGWQLDGDAAEAYERYLATSFAPWARRLVELAGIGSGQRVLDVACGTGIVARQAAASVGASGQVVGLDLNDDMLRVARAAAATTVPPIEWRQGDAGRLPFPDGSFDAVVCEQAIQFFPDPDAAVREMRRVLSPGGRAAVSVCRPIRFAPTYVALAGVLERHVGRDAAAIMRSPFPDWAIDRVRGPFSRAGFADVRVTIDVWPLRYPSPAEFLRREASGSPLAGPVGAMDPARRDALLSDLAEAVADHVDDDGVACPIEVYVAVARR